MAKRNESNEIHIVRIYDAPVKLVWDAWTDVKQVAKWWGPRGFTLTTHSKDLRPGGHWKYTMHGPDGTDWPNNTIYHEVKQYERLVYDHGGNDERPPMFRVTVSFSESRGKTKMEMTMALPTVEAAAETRKFIKKAGGDSTWDRLAEYLSHETSGKEQFVINRSFEAPIDVVFKAWSDPKQICRWLPPIGLTMEYIEADVAPGKTTFYLMTDGEDFKMYGLIKYVEITKPNRIVYSQEFCDKDKKMSRHPMLPTWPATMNTVVTLTEEGPSQTRVTVQWEPHAQATAAEIETFKQMRGNMTQGWTGSFDKLDEFLGSLN